MRWSLLGSAQIIAAHVLLLFSSLLRPVEPTAEAKQSLGDAEVAGPHRAVHTLKDLRTKSQWYQQLQKVTTAARHLSGCLGSGNSRPCLILSLLLLLAVMTLHCSATKGHQCCGVAVQVDAVSQSYMPGGFPATGLPARFAV